MTVAWIVWLLTENAFTATRSKEADVYSYGVVLLELITQKNALDPSFMGGTDIVGWVRYVWSQSEDISGIVDSRLLDECVESDIKEQVINVLLVALRCTDKEPGKRPTMRDVVRQLLKANVSERSKTLH